MMFSFLLPTRERPELVARFFQSLVDTTGNLDDLEIVLCIDEDDALSKTIEDDRLLLKKVVVPKGLNMGELNRVCFKSSSGQYVMLVNDDIIVRTRNWDRTIASVFRSYKDEIALIHVNDLLFRDKLCTFPFLSRRACDAIGICPVEYRRYRIDDHIWDTYCILAHLGHKRIIYLPDVIFQHDNYSKAPTDYDGQRFESEDNKTYIPNKLILEKDAALFDRSFHQRKQDALTLATIIDQSAHSSRTSTYAAQLGSLRDQYSCRKPEYVHTFPFSACKTPLDSMRITIGVVTGDFRRDHASRCLSLLKQHTSRFDLILLDNNRSTDFNHPREMNKILSAAKTDYVVLMDDDVFVTPGWLQGMLKAMDSDTGVVVPMHKDKTGGLSFSGAYFMGDDFGMHAHHKDIPDRPREIQCACSAMLLIDMNRCGHVRFNEQYNKYFLDIDYSLKIWETGYKLVVTPEVTVTHLAGATLPQGSIRSTQLWNRDMPKFKKDWIDSGRLSKIQTTVWKKYPFLMLLTTLPQRIRRLFEGEPSWEFSAFQEETEELIESTAAFPLFQSLLVNRLDRFVSHCDNRSDTLKADYCRSLLSNLLKKTRMIPEGFSPILIESYKGYNLVEYGMTCFSCPQSLGQLDLTKEEDRRKTGILSSMNLEQAKDLIDKTLWDISKDSQTSSLVNEISISETKVDIPLAMEPSVPILVQEGYRGFNIIRYGNRFYSIPQGQGVFDPEGVRERRYDPIFEGDSIESLKQNIKQTVGIKIRHLLPLMKSRCSSFGRLLKRLNSLTILLKQNMHVASDVSKKVEPTVRLIEKDVFPGALEPTVIEHDYSGYSICLFSTKYFAIKASQAPFAISRYRQNLYSDAIVGNTLAEVKGEINQRKATQEGKKPKALFLCCVPPQSAEKFLNQLPDHNVTLLVPKRQKEAYTGYPTVILFNSSGEVLRAPDLASMSPAQLHELSDKSYDVVILPHSGPMYWKDTQFETFAGQLCNRLMIVTPSGQRRFYKGEDIHRIRYNKAYLNSMFSYVPTLAGKRILDVGCSDGLVCDLLLSEEPESIVGIDVLETVGCVYSHHKITYHQQDATRMSFQDASFDLVISIATLEHIEDARRALEEIKRVTKPGGYIYIQTGPLYYSPYGHHMFGYFDDTPWIHLRLSVDQIVEHCRRFGIDKKIRVASGRSAQEYVQGMLNKAHINGKAFEEYGLLDFMKQGDLEVIHFSRSWEGENLLTKGILAELSHIGKEKLISHGFELVAKVK